MLLINVFDIVGTVAFAISGALVGIQKKLDLFGVIFLAITTAVGGGVFRDIILGNIPPIAFTKSIYCFISVISALVTWFFYNRIIKLKNIILILDALGLGAFTAIGGKAAFLHDFNQPLIVVSMGVITGVGGGILRDVFSKQIPLVFRKEIYAAASILGGLSLYYCERYFQSINCLYICFFVTFIVRILAIKYDTNLPVLKVNLEEDIKNTN